MACYSHLTAYRTRSGAIVFDVLNPDIVNELKLPCGKCIGCRLERTRQWAVRCVHEASLHNDNCFITLTFNDENVPYSLDKADFQLFMKRLRKYVGSKECAKDYPDLYKRKISYFQCGEYGEKGGRPHYHACLFNIDFPDKEYLPRNRETCKLYTSKLLEKLWGFGFVTIGEVTFDSAAYVAQYITKKITGPDAVEHYAGRLPEFCLMSRRPAIALHWLDKFHTDVYPRDEVIVNSHPAKPPRYYDKYLEKNFPEKLDLLKMKREHNGLEINPLEAGTHRMHVKHQCKILKRNEYVRSMEGKPEYNKYDDKCSEYVTSMLNHGEKNEA